MKLQDANPRQQSVTPGGARRPAEPVHSPLVRKFSHLVELSNQEIAWLEGLHGDRRLIPAGMEILAEGDRFTETLVVNGGWAIRYQALPDGRRQIVNFFLAGDIIGPFASVIEASEHAVAAITDLEVSVFRPQRILKLFAEAPRLGALYGWSAGRDEAIVAEQVVRLGRRSAFERTGHLLLEILRRLQMVGLAGERTFRMPLTQEILADTLGLSAVHMSRTLRRLRAARLVELADRRVTIPDVPRLQRITDFSTLYLEQHRLPPKTEQELRRL